MMIKSILNVPIKLKFYNYLNRYNFNSLNNNKDTLKNSNLEIKGNINNISTNSSSNSESESENKSKSTDSDELDEISGKKKNNQEREIYDISIIKSLNFKKYFSIKENTIEENIIEENKIEDLKIMPIEVETPLEKISNHSEEEISQVKTSKDETIDIDSTEKKILSFIENLNKTPPAFHLIEIIKNHILNDFTKNEIISFQTINKNFDYNLSLFNLLLCKKFDLGEYISNTEISLTNNMQINNLDLNDLNYTLKIYIIMGQSKFINYLIFQILAKIFNNTIDIDVENKKNYDALILILEYFSYNRDVVIKPHPLIKNILISILNVPNKDKILIDRMLINSELFLNYEGISCEFIELGKKFIVDYNYNYSLKHFLKIVSMYFNMMSYRKEKDFDYFQEIFKILSQSLSKGMELNIDGENAIKLIHPLCSLYLNLSAHYDLKNNKIQVYTNELISKIFLYWVKKDYKSLNLYQFTLTLISFKNFIYISNNRISKFNSELLNKLWYEFRHKIDLFEDPFILINLIDQLKSKKDYELTGEYLKYVMNKIYQRLYMIKNKNFSEFNKIIHKLFVIDVDKEVFLYLRPFYMEKLFYSTLSSEITTTNFELHWLVNNLYNFSAISNINEKKENKEFIHNEIEELRNINYSLTSDDLSNILQKIIDFFGNNWEVLIKYILISPKFTKKLHHLTFNSSKANELFHLYFYKVFYPSLIITYRSIDQDFKSNYFFLDFILSNCNAISRIPNNLDMMTLNLKTAALVLYQIKKLHNNKLNYKKDLLELLFKFYDYYMISPNVYEEIAKRNKKHQFLKYLLRQRFILGRDLKDIKPLKLIKIEPKLENSISQLTDDYFFR